MNVIRKGPGQRSAYLAQAGKHEEYGGQYVWRDLVWYQANASFGDHLAAGKFRQSWLLAQDSQLLTMRSLRTANKYLHL